MTHKEFTGTGIVVPQFSDEIPPKMTESFEQLATALAQGQAAVEELAVLKPILAFAINQLPRKQLRISLTEQSALGALDVQAKRSNNGSLYFRAVKAGA